MGLLGGKRSKPRAKVMRASGQRLDLADRADMRRLALARQGQSWQKEAWSYRGLIGELRFATLMKARQVSKVRYYPAEIVEDEDEPIPFDSADARAPEPLRRAAMEELSRLPLSAGYSFWGVLSENLSSYSGEAWLHGYLNPLTDEETWEVLSTSEVNVSSDGVLSIQRAGESMRHDIRPDSPEEILRLWVPDPEHPGLADSPMRSLRDVCEGILLDGQELRTASRSRVATNGILLVPDTMAQLASNRPGQGSAEDDPDENPFQAELTAALVEPIGDERHSSAAAPVVITGDVEDIKAVRHIRLDRPDSPEVTDRVVQGLRRLAQGLEIPPEMMSGLGDANHWSAWLVDSSNYKYFLSSDIRTIADSLTEGFLRPALLARGFAPAEVRLVQVWWDAGVLTENPNRGADAITAFDRFAIGREALRQALGFADSDAPDDDELLQMIAAKIGVDPATSAALLELLLGTKGLPTAPRVIQGQPAPPALPPASPAEGQAPPDNGTPQTTPPGITAAGLKLAALLTADGAPVDYQVNTELARELMEIDRQLRDRIIMATDAMMVRALEKAGARIRTKVSRNAALRAQLGDAPVTEFGRILGREALLAALGPDEKGLLEGAFDALAEKFAQWTAAAITAAARVVLRMLGFKRGDAHADRVTERITAPMKARVPASYDKLRDRLMSLADTLLFHPHPDIEPGEASTEIVPVAIVREALAEVGGNQDGFGGIGTGDAVAGALSDAGANELGFQWAYGISLNHYEWHRELDGARFTGFEDDRLSTVGTGQEWVGSHFHPGDHNNCHCDFVMVWAVPDHSQVLRNLLLPESEGARNDRVLAESDDRAGRLRTTAQAARDERQRILALQKRFIGGDR
jgi:hypothetical protein